MYIKVGEEEEEAQERRGGKVGQRQKRKAYERSVSRQINTTLGRNNRMGKVSLHRVCANRLMKTGRPGPCRTKVNDVINTLYRFQKGFVSSCYFFLFFFLPPLFSFYSVRFEQIRSRARKYCPSCRCERGGEGKGRRMVTNVNSAERRNSIVFRFVWGKRGGPLYLSLLHPSSIEKYGGIRKNRVDALFDDLCLFRR